MKLKKFFTTYEKDKIFSFSFKQFTNFLIKLFAIWGIITALIFIIEPYYFQQIKLNTSFNIRNSRTSINSVFLDIEWREPVLEEVFSGEKKVNIKKGQREPLKISNTNIYKIENLSWKLNMSFVAYSSKYNSIFSPIPYNRYDTVQLFSWNCLYIGRPNFFMRKKEKNKDNDWNYLNDSCTFIPSSWLNWYMWRYPFSLLTFSSWNWSEIKITELKHHTDDT